jgi:Predicted membrane protein
MASIMNRISGYIPGVVLCLVISIIAVGLQAMEEALTGRPWIEALVIAILLGAVVRTLFQPGKIFLPGMAFCAKTLLEIAVVLLGASISLQTLSAAGAQLILGIAVTVFAAIGASYLIGRALGLPQRMAILVACGNSICGNSAIAAVAPVIQADSDDIASSIAFTAILGVIVVLTLPLLIPVLGYSQEQYGILAGMTVYAVPQVLAATMPVGLLATQIGTLVKLVRVLMLGPVVIAMSFLAPRLQPSSHPMEGQAARLSAYSAVPWFIIGFLLLMLLRSLNVIPDFLLHYSSYVTLAFTIIAMAALGLGVDLRVLSKVGGRVTAAVILSLCVLLAISILLIRLTAA